MPENIRILLWPEDVAFDLWLALSVLLALALIVALASVAGRVLALFGERAERRWTEIGLIPRALLRGLFVAWSLLLLLTVAAGIRGAFTLVTEPGEAGLGLGALLVALLGAPFLIWGTVIRQTTLDYQREGHITDRIAKAVEKLGTEKTVKVPAEGGGTAERSEPNIEVRLGAILALERIAQDSTRLDNGRDHVRVMEALLRKSPDGRASPIPGQT